MGLRVTQMQSRRPRLVRATLWCCVLLAASVPLIGGVAHARASEVSAERLGGDDRYETAVQIAERFADEIDGDLRTAVVVSGHDAHAACALLAAALSGKHKAPVLLTEPDALPAVTGSFIARSGVQQVYIVGGTPQVSAGVSDRLEQISGSAPIRLAGTDCAAAAVEIAQSLGSPRWHPGRGRTALLATDSAVVDGLAAGPLAYSAAMPVLLTRGGELAADAADYLDRRTDHVIILGGPAAVSAAVEGQLHALGLTTQRWAGVDRFGTAARIATELLESSPPGSCFGGGGVGLASGHSTADAIASAPLLGELCHPLLLVTRGALPQVSAAVLSGEAIAGDGQGALTLTIFGGHAAVSTGARQAALNAAGADLVGLGPPVGSTISAVEGACHWTVTFGEPVLVRDASRLSNYTFEGAALTADAAEIDAGSGTTTALARIVLVGASRHALSSELAGCSRPLAVRDRLGVVAGTMASTDGTRVNRGAELIVRADTSLPSLRIYAPLETQTVWVRSSEPLTDGAITVTLARGRSRLTNTVPVDDGGVVFRVPFSFPADGFAPVDLPFVRSPWLMPGDRITVPSGRLHDRAGNRNTASTHVVGADTVAPRIVSAAVAGIQQHIDGSVTADIAVRWSEPIQGCSFGPARHTVNSGALHIDHDGDSSADYSLDGNEALISLVAAPGGNPSIVAGAVACDQSWQATDGTLVARLSARSAAVLPTASSKLFADAGAVHDFAGNASQAQTAVFQQQAHDGR